MKNIKTNRIISKIITLLIFITIILIMILEFGFSINNRVNYNRIMKKNFVSIYVELNEYSNNESVYQWDSKNIDVVNKYKNICMKFSEGNQPRKIWDYYLVLCFKTENEENYFIKIIKDKGSKEVYRSFNNMYIRKHLYIDVNN